jgi:hypothetical protein
MGISAAGAIPSLTPAAGDPLASGLSSWQVLTRGNAGAQALNATDYAVLRLP